MKNAGPGGYFCPVCETSVGEFAPLPEYYRENLRKHRSSIALEDLETLNVRQYSCPECGAADRDRLCALYLEKRLGAPEKEARKVVIEFAPSRAFTSLIRRKYPHIELRTADLSMEGVDDRVDIMEMGSYPDGCADAFVCSHVLEHVADDRKAFRELYRILKPGGWGILMVPILVAADSIDEEAGPLSDAERWRRFGQNDHVRIYSRGGFLARAAEAGFSVDRLGIGHFGREAFRKCGIADGSVLYVAEKRCSAKQDGSKMD